jgi:hypothetical protein
MRAGTSVAPILIWFVAGIALLVAFELIENPFIAMMLLPVVALIYLAIAVVLLVGYVRIAIKERNKKSWTAVASIPGLVVVLMLIAPLITRLVVYAEFAAKLPAYTRIVDAVTKVPSSREPLFQPADEVMYYVDKGPPVRVAFPKNGIIDNWWGIIYDPSDAVAQARGWNFDTGAQVFTAPPEIRTLFGGDLVSCWRLYRHYYSCSFT